MLVSRSDNTVKIYHAGNRRYADNGFMASLNANIQTITFCGVGAHHQNGISEQRILTVTKISRTILLHAQHYWPEFVDTILCPFAVKAAIDKLNLFQLDLYGNAPTVKL